MILMPKEYRAPLGIRPKPEYGGSCVYVCDAFFAIAAGSSLALPQKTIQSTTTAEEVYFRHVSAINQRDGFNRNHPHARQQAEMD